MAPWEARAGSPAQLDSVAAVPTNSSPSHVARSVPWGEVSAAQRVACAEVWHQVWPASDGTDVDARVAKMESQYASQEGLQLHLAFDEAGSLMAVARTFLHTVAVGDQPVDIVALASVCSDPTHRGEGWGDTVVQAAFERVATEGRPAFFQSPVPTYYERFGSRLVNNKIITSVEGAAAFSDPWAMIHPAEAPWDDEPVIDLLAPGW